MAAISMKLYRKHPETWWRGKKVRLLREITTNGGTIYPAGTEATIEYKYNGFDLRGAKCACCGVSLSLRRIDILDVELIEGEENGR